VVKRKVIWSEFSSIMLYEIYAYYKETAGERIAQKLKSTIFHATRQLIEYPSSGQEEESLKILGRVTDIWLKVITR
jgi:toxin ParE1/3/4